MFGNLTDVQQSVGAGKDLNESTEFSQPHHLAQVGLPYFRDRGEVADHRQCFLQTFFIAGGNIHAAGVVDVNLHAGGLDDAANGFAARSDQIANLVCRYLQGVDLRSELGSLDARGRLHRVHLVQQEQSSATGLFERLTHDLTGHSADLDIHLQRGDALTRACDFKVHVAVVIFGARNVSQDGVTVTLLDQSHGDTGNGSLQRNACVHESQTCSADAGHGGRAIRFENV